MTCEFCGSDRSTSHSAYEMMYGWRERFEYVECDDCRCLKIARIPADLGKYYPPDSYNAYVFNDNLRTRARRLVLKVAAGNPIARKPLQALFGMRMIEFIGLFGLKRNMRILDVGCGAAQLIRDLRAAGFRGAMGVDPFIPDDIHDKLGLAVKKTQFSQIPCGWDCIMFHHSLEHIPDQVGVLRLVREKLAPGGICIIRIPVANWAWENYGADWVQLDPPRHLCIHTEKSLSLAAARAGLRVVKTIYDSFDFQFWGSELYKRGVPLNEGRQHLDKYFSKDELANFETRAEALNREGHGDQAIFFVKALEQG